MYVYQYGMLEECKKLKNTSHSSNFFLSFYQHSTQVLQWQLAEDPLSCLKHHGMCSSDYRELCFLSHITMWSLILSQNQPESASSDTSTLTNTYAIMNVPHEKPYHLKEKKLPKQVTWIWLLCHIDDQICILKTQFKVQTNKPDL